MRERERERERKKNGEKDRNGTNGERYLREPKMKVIGSARERERGVRRRGRENGWD